MTKYEKCIEDLVATGIGTMKCFGNSMTPIIMTASILEFQKFDLYEVGDIVFCRVKGRYIDAHLITAKNEKRGYLISNNHGFQNGWTRTIYGKVVKINDIVY